MNEIRTNKCEPKCAFIDKFKKLRLPLIVHLFLNYFSLFHRQNYIPGSYNLYAFERCTHGSLWLFRIAAYAEHQRTELVILI